jgi:hypothetical protein
MAAVVKPARRRFSTFDTAQVEQALDLTARFMEIANQTSGARL